MGHFLGQLRIQGPVKRLGDVVFNEVDAGNIAERQSAQLDAGLPAYIVIACAAYVQITLFELVGEHEYLAELIVSHVRNDFTVSYRHSEHGFASAEEVVTGTKARLRISAFRDSAVTRA